LNRYSGIGWEATSRKAALAKTLGLEAPPIAYYFRFAQYCGNRIVGGQAKRRPSR